MREMEQITTLEQMDRFISSQKMSFLYLSRTQCSVCHALLPQIKELMLNYPDIKLAHINVDDVEEVAGRLSIFTVPVLILYVDGKEHLREARFVHVDTLDQKINKIYRNVTQ
ncbi:thioredoxin family protein [Aquibacillus sediminis]|uniref:thioredoxin family protein n=1 Tax=Aquibacillus sediminis TaxID=2574734 RepID=UPI0011098D49|nr:thioredoxin family protein [Aquibacillus sediminis]